MAFVFKRRKYAPVPETAVVVAAPTRSDPDRRLARWVDAEGKEQSAEVVATESGVDRIILRELRNWYVSFPTPEGRKQRRAYSDKAASQALADRLEREAARRREGLIDPIDDHLKRPILEHLDDFMATRPGSLSGRYRDQLKRRIERVIEGIKATRLGHLDPVGVERFLTGLTLGGYARNEYVGNLKEFTRWAVESKRLRDDPLSSLRKAARKKIKRKHPRRALTPAEIASLLHAAGERPVKEALTIRRGRDKGMLKARVREKIIADLKRLGEERRLCYLIAIWTGLRRSEIRSLRWSDLRLEADPPFIQLRADATKAKRADVIAIHPQLRAALLSARAGAKEFVGGAVVRSVPDMKAVRADLVLAGIDPGSEEIGFVDFHSLRKSLGTMMAVARMSQRARQSHMRHTDPRLTEVTYMDERLLPVADELAKVPFIPSEETVRDALTPVPSQVPPDPPHATQIQHARCTLVLDLASDDKIGQQVQEETVELVVRGPRSQVLEIQRFVRALTVNDKTPHR